MVITSVAGDTLMNKKRTKGKQKIDIKKIEDPNSLQVAFSKRRTGLFKKAAEICVLTGAQIAILVTSPADRFYGFRHPNTDVLFDDFLNDNNTYAATNTTTGGETGTTQKNYLSPAPPPIMEEFNQHYSEVSRELEAEKKRGGKIPESSGASRWYEEPVDGLDVEEAQQYLCSLDELKKKVLTRAVELMMINKSSALFFGSNNGIQPPVDIPSNAVVDDGGFNFEYDGNFGNF
ncbi:agamous-like MADS-box protein AGL62 [Lactuca sativa]|uniref:agamous-like MADS-box protein AGL62 n=1 Tax=Lactuca sativa TaxID=4236 RepID=UPI000CBB4E41|nr:agamous-like MADS-box protein AGL62 [Lactuca sativa]